MMLKFLKRLQAVKVMSYVSGEMRWSSGCADGRLLLCRARACLTFVGAQCRMRCVCVCVCRALDGQPADGL